MTTLSSPDRTTRAATGIDPRGPRFGAAITSILLAAAGVFVYSRWRFPQAFMDVLSVAPIIILILFFGFSSTSRLVLPREQPEPVDATISNPAPVVMVIFDEFPTGSLSARQPPFCRKKSTQRVRKF